MLLTSPVTMILLSAVGAARCIVAGTALALGPAEGLLILEVESVILTSPLVAGRGPPFPARRPFTRARLLLLTRESRGWSSFPDILTVALMLGRELI